MVAQREKKEAADKSIGNTRRHQVVASKEASSARLGPSVGNMPAFSSVAPELVNFIVNGRAYSLQVEPNWPLRDVLRQKLGLTSVKDFCDGYGACGSCAVILNDRPVLSCMILAVECDGATIETAEGIADIKHPLIEAYIMNWTAQCGYCTPGFLVTAKSLLDHNTNPTEEEIKDALAGNLCRCGNYPAHIKAIKQAAKVLRGEN
jgi:aerobic-type carbon monoxide dehydrogenase small subunit (CoxS/CutS family)